MTLVLPDTNVWLDYFLPARPAHAASSALIARCLRQGVTLLTTTAKEVYPHVTALTEQLLYHTLHLIQGIHLAGMCRKRCYANAQTPVTRYAFPTPLISHATAPHGLC